MTRSIRPVRPLALVVAAAIGAGVACVPPEPPLTTLRITTELTICGGVIPPPGEPWCRTRVVPRAVDVLQGRTIVASGTSSNTGTLTLIVPAGALAVSAADEPPYLDCDVTRVTAIANVDTPATQSCTLNAP